MAKVFQDGTGWLGAVLGSCAIARAHGMQEACVLACGIVDSSSPSDDTFTLVRVPELRP